MILTAEKWRDASMFELAPPQLAVFKPEGGELFETVGYNAHLAPDAAQHVGLALHELATWSRSPAPCPRRTTGSNSAANGRRRMQSESA